MGLQRIRVVVWVVVGGLVDSCGGQRQRRAIERERAMLVGWCKCKVDVVVVDCQCKGGKGLVVDFRPLA
eukprot:58538-Amphidinium_carterae.1